MATSMRDLERETGISRSMIERILNKKRTKDDDKKRIVLNAIQRFNYNPLVNSPQIKKIITRTIGLVTPYTKNLNMPYFSRAVEGVKSISSDNEYDFILYSEKEIIKKTKEEFYRGRQNINCDGLIVFSPIAEWESYLKVLTDWGIPCVLVRRKTDIKGVVMVHDNDCKGIGLLMDHLYKLGHRNIAFISRTPRSTSLTERKQGFLEFMQGNGLTIDEESIIEQNLSEQEMWDRIAPLWERPNPPTAMVCYDDYIAVGMMNLLQDHGIRVPEDCAVTGYNNDPISYQARPSLTTVNTPVSEICESACSVLFKALESEYHGPVDMEFENKLVVRESSGHKLKD
jgi:DNA-binding LacI/PurR family transcriptional regulator